MLVDHVRSVMQMHEANKVVIYSPALREQIPRSKAGWAFNQFQTSMHQFELLRLLAVWDGYGDNRVSIPTVLALIDDPAIEAQLIEEARHHFGNLGVHDLSPTDDPEIQALKDEWLQSYRATESAREARVVERRLRFAHLLAKRIQSSDRLPALREFRDQYLAHNLVLTDAELDPAMKGRRARYGDERTLLKQTIRIADALHLALNGSGFMWDDARDDYREQVQDLWGRCRFDFPAVERPA